MSMEFPTLPNLEGRVVSSSSSSNNSGLLVGIAVIGIIVVIVIVLSNRQRQVTPAVASKMVDPQTIPLPPPEAPVVPAVSQIPLRNQGPTFPAGAPEPSPYNTMFGKEPQYAEYVPSANYNLQYRQPINATKISMVEIKTPESFHDIVEQNKKDCVVAFISRNCGHCTAMKPAFEQAANQSMIPFLLVEQAVAQPAGLLEKYKIEGFPTVIRFSGGLPVAYFKEARTPENLIKFAK